MPYFQYPLADYLRDVDALNDSGAFNSGPFERVLANVRQHFAQQYSNEQERQWKAFRFAATLMYLSDHLEDFDRGRLSVFGSRTVGSLVSEHLLRAIHAIMILDPEYRVDCEPSPTVISELASSYSEP